MMTKEQDVYFKESQELYEILRKNILNHTPPDS